VLLGSSRCSALSLASRGHPAAAFLETFSNASGVGLQVARPGRRCEEVGPEPLEAAPVLGGVLPVDFGGALAEVRLAASGGALGPASPRRRRHRPRRPTAAPGRSESSSFPASSSPASWVPMGSGSPLLDGVQVDEVAQDVALDRLQERLAAALQPLEQVGAAEAHQALAGAGEVGDQLGSAGVGGCAASG
jgi:hypothetical protein